MTEINVTTNKCLKGFMLEAKAQQSLQSYEGRETQT